MEPEPAAEPSPAPVRKQPVRRSSATSGAVGPGLRGTGLGRKRFPGLPSTPWAPGQPTVPTRAPRTWRGGRLLCWCKCASFCIFVLIARAAVGGVMLEGRPRHVVLRLCCSMCHAARYTSR